MSLILNKVIILEKNHPFENCLSYEVINDELIIKAFIRHSGSDTKQYIHVSYNTLQIAKEFYNQLQQNLFNILNENNIILKSTNSEKVKDDSTKRIIKLIILLEIPVIIIFTIITLIAYFKYHYEN